MSAELVEKLDGHTDQRIINRYTNQPAVLPQDVRVKIEKCFDGKPIILYALADLDAQMSLSQTWVAVGERYIAIATRKASDIHVDVIERHRIRKLHERPGLSCTVLSLIAEEHEPVLAVLRYSHRQRQAMENVKFILNEQLNGNLVQVEDANQVYASAVAEPLRKAQATMARNRLAVIWRLLGYLKPYRVNVSVGIMAAAMMTVLTLLSPYLAKFLIDEVYQPFSVGTLSHEQAMQLGFYVIAAIALTYLLAEFCHWLRLRFMSVIGELVAYDLRKELYSHLQELNLAFFSSKQTGSLISRVSHDTDRLWEFLAVGIVEISLSLLMLLGLSVVLISLDWRLGLILTLPIPLLLWLLVRHSMDMQRLFTLAWRKWSSLTAVLSDTIPGIRVVKAFNQEQQEINRFNERNKTCLTQFNDIHKVWTKFWPRLLFLLHMMILLVWIFALPRLLDGSAGEYTPLSIGTFTAFLLYMRMFFQPIETIGMMTRMMNRATSSAVRIFEILDTKAELKPSVDLQQLNPVKGGVRFENVSFAYDGVRQVLKTVNFEVKPGEMIGLVGPSGSGKTTITNLIAHFYAPTHGRVLIDGVDIAQLDIGHFRRQVGMVLQDPHLFHGTVLENIRYGVDDVDLARIIEAARAANAHDFICNLPHGYETVVGERGHTLSGGERQRISIARAILTDPRILILDEATSSVDTETESKIQEAIDRLIEGRTVFAIAHRLSTLRRAKRLFVMKDGCLVEQGTHEQLLNIEDGVYRKLSEMQRKLHDNIAV